MKVLSSADLRERGIKYDREHLRRLINAGKFPRPFKLSGAGPTGRNAWVESEIDAWLEQRAAARTPAAGSVPPSSNAPRGQSVAKQARRTTQRGARGNEGAASESQVPAVSGQ